VVAKQPKIGGKCGSFGLSSTFVEEEIRESLFIGPFLVLS